MKNASRSVAWAGIAPLATLLLLALAAAAPLWGPGLLNTRGGGDSPFLLMRTHQLVANLQDKVFPARWMPDAAYGLGYPFFSYYAALPYYVASSFHLVGLGMLTSIKLTQTLFAAAAAVTMYGWSRGVLRGRASAWLAAVAYTFVPFHLVNVYVRGDSLSEFAAFAFYPLILWGLDRLAAQPSLKCALMPSLAYAGLIVTHNVSALIFSPFVLLYVAFHLVRAVTAERHQRRAGIASRHLLLILPVALALLLSAWFWLPALAETDEVQLTAQTTGYFTYANHFRGRDLIQPGLVFNYSTDAVSGSPFAMGLLHALLTGAGVLFGLFTFLPSRSGAGRVGERFPGARESGSCARLPLLGLALGAVLLSTWMVTPLSRPLWERLPLLQLVQFPWRFLSVQALFASPLIGFPVSYLASRRRWVGWAAALALGAALLTTALGGLDVDFLPISAADVTTDRLQLYELFTGNIGSTIRYEYLPRWVNPRPYAGPGDVSPENPVRDIAAAGDLLRADRVEYSSTSRVWRVATGTEGAQVAFPVYYWPGWYAVLDGKRTQAAPVEGAGTICVRVPQGRHTVELRLGRTPLRLAAELASLVTLLASIGFWLVTRVREGGDQSPKDPALGALRDAKISSRRMVFVAAIPFLAALLLLVTLQPRVEATASDDLTMDFDRMPYLHHNPEGAVLDGWRLTSYTFEAAGGTPGETVAPGETLQVALDWEMDEAVGGSIRTPDPQVLQLVPPAAVRNPDLPAAAEGAFSVGKSEGDAEVQGRTVVRLTVPEEAAPGIHLLRLGDTPSIYLRPLWIGDSVLASSNPALQTFVDGALLLQEVEVNQEGPDRVAVRLQWYKSSPVATNYGLSLSLKDVAGREWLQQGSKTGYDTQPGQGFLPTSLWPLGRVFNDHHVPALRPGIPPSDSYQLMVDLYHVPTWRSVGHYTTTVGLTAVSRRYDAPVEARFGDEIQLSELEVPQTVRQGEELSLTAFWNARKEPSADYVAVWQLRRPGDVISSTGPLAAGSSPQEWPAGAWVAGRTALTIPPTTAPGTYTLSVAVLRGVGGPPLGTFTHPIAVEIVAQERTWVLPAMETRVGAEFGDMIELAGYDLSQEEQQLQITLYWRALRTPDRHYAFFVHLADPETGIPASQVDSMPRGYTYPTGQWAPGEVIADDVALSTAEVPSGQYVLAVGWYEPDTMRRLPASNSEGRALLDDRVLLPSRIAIR